VALDNVCFPVSVLLVFYNCSSSLCLNFYMILSLIDFLYFHSRGAILACALPWLKSVLLQHASGIISQESSLLALNSLFQVRNGYFIVEIF
jgi:hypothetical protein